MSEVLPPNSSCPPIYGREADNSRANLNGVSLTLYALCVFVSLANDLLLLFLICSKSDMRKIRLNLHLANMALVDLGMSVTMFGVYILNAFGAQIFGAHWNLMVRPISGFTEYFYMSSFYSVAAISVELHRLVARNPRSTLVHRLASEQSMFCYADSVLLLVITHLFCALFAGTINSLKDALVNGRTLREIQVKLFLILLIRDALPMCVTIVSLLAARLRYKEMKTNAPSFMQQALRNRQRSLHIVTALGTMLGISSVPLLATTSYQNYIVWTAPMDSAECAANASALNTTLSNPILQWTYRVSIWVWAISSNLTMIVLLWSSYQLRTRTLALLKTLSKVIHWQKSKKTPAIPVLCMTEMSIAIFGEPPSFDSRPENDILAAVHYSKPFK